MITHPFRKRILAFLAMNKGISRAELATLLAASTEVTASEVNQLELSLHHNHLPRLASEGYIDYDQRSGEIVLWKDADTLLAELGDN